MLVVVCVRGGIPVDASHGMVPIVFLISVCTLPETSQSVDRNTSPSGELSTRRPKRLADKLSWQHKMTDTSSRRSTRVRPHLDQSRKTDRILLMAQVGPSNRCAVWSSGRCPSIPRCNWLGMSVGVPVSLPGHVLFKAAMAEAVEPEQPQQCCTRSPTSIPTDQAR